MAVVVPPWLIGTLLGLFGSIGINTGNNLQSLGLHKLEEMYETSNDPEIMDKEVRGKDSKIWIIGTVIFITGSLMNFAAFGFAPQGLLASLEAIQFVSNIAFGKFVFGAYVSPRMYLGTVSICTGTILIVLFSSKVAVKWTVQALMNNYLRLDYQIFLAAMAALAVVLFLATRALMKANQVKGAEASWTQTAEPVAYAVFSAIFGTQAVVLAKCLASILENGHPVFTHWFLYVTLVAWIGFVGVWLYRMNDALGKYNALFIIPMLQANYIFGAIVAGGVFFNEFAGFTWEAWLGFVLGMIGIFLGLFLLRPPVEEDEVINAELQAHLEALAQAGGDGGSNPGGAAGPADGGIEMKTNPMGEGGAGVDGLGGLRPAVRTRPRSLGRRTSRKSVFMPAAPMMRSPSTARAPNGLRVTRSAAGPPRTAASRRASLANAFTHASLRDIQETRRRSSVRMGEDVTASARELGQQDDIESTAEEIVVQQAVVDNEP